MASIPLDDLSEALQSRQRLFQQCDVELAVILLPPPVLDGTGQRAAGNSPQTEATRQGSRRSTRARSFQPMQMLCTSGPATPDALQLLMGMRLR